MIEYDGKKKIAVITYNRIGSGQYDNGVLETQNNQIYIAQNGHKTKWAVEGDKGILEERTEIRSRSAIRAARDVDLKQMNHIFLYVGTYGSEDVIRETRGIPAEKLSYVLCDCNYDTKMRMINSIGNSDSEIINSECGGRETLERIIEKLKNER